MDLWLLKIENHLVWDWSYCSQQYRSNDRFFCSFFGISGWNNQVIAELQITRLAEVFGHLLQLRYLLIAATLPFCFCSIILRNYSLSIQLDNFYRFRHFILKILGGGASGSEIRFPYIFLRCGAIPPRYPVQRSTLQILSLCKPLHTNAMRCISMRIRTGNSHPLWARITLDEVIRQASHQLVAIPFPLKTCKGRKALGF